MVKIFSLLLDLMKINKTKLDLEIFNARYAMTGFDYFPPPMLFKAIISLLSGMSLQVKR